MTERLYHADPYLREFTARVVRKTPEGVVLDRTAFYPAGGGQPCDLGTLNGLPVTDVVEAGDDVVHAVDGPLEGEVRGAIDWARRRAHMQQHHGQHLLSEAFVRVAQAQTTSFHLGRRGCTIDLDRKVSAAHLEGAEAVANETVWANRPVEVAIFTPEEAARLPMRKPPPAAGRIRVVTVPDYDCQACCGTHPRATGEVGVVLVTGAEHQKDTSRVHFVCGLRALAEAHEDARVVHALAAKLSAPRDDIEKALDRLREESAATRRQLAAAEKTLAAQRGRELAARGNVVVELFEGKGIEYLRAVASQVAAVPGKVAILGGAGETSSVVIGRSPDVAVDLRPLFGDILAVIQGKGGGAANFVQGGGPGKDLRAALEKARERIVESLGS